MCFIKSSRSVAPFAACCFAGEEGRWAALLKITALEPMHMTDLFSLPADFLVALLQIIGINIVLSGDNAVVIALASRSLPPEQQRRAVIWGSGAAIVMRIVLTFTAASLLNMPYLKLIGSLFLLWVGVQLLDSDEAGDDIQSGSNMAAAIRTILMADLVMSLDNVLGVAAAAKGNFLLLLIGLGISIPLIVFGANMLLKLMERFPVIIVIGAALLGYVGGEMAVTDQAYSAWIDEGFYVLHQVVPLLCAVFVVVVGKVMAKRKMAAA